MATTFDIQLPHYPRGFHLITRDILSLLPDLPENGLLVVFSIPIRNHRLNLGTWQGIYLCEFRDGGDKRKLSITILE